MDDWGEAGPRDAEQYSGRPIGEIRALRKQAVQTETGLSYLRRLVQGSLDIIGSELARRSTGTDPVTASSLVGELPAILGDPGRPPGTGRLQPTLEPVEVDPEMMARYETLVGDGRLGRVSELAGAELAELLDGLGRLEVEISSRRRAYHARIDALGAEIGRRYQTGEASVDELLRDVR